MALLLFGGFLSLPVRCVRKEQDAQPSLLLKNGPTWNSDLEVSKNLTGCLQEEDTWDGNQKTGIFASNEQLSE